jgi:hypothetical protein
VAAVHKAGDLYVELGPNQSKSNYPFTVMKRVTSTKWKKVRTASTSGAKDIVVLKLPAGWYRIVVPARFGYRGVTSKVVRLLR